MLTHRLSYPILTATNHSEGATTWALPGVLGNKGITEHEPILGNGQTRKTGTELRAGIGGKQICKREQISKKVWEHRAILTRI